MSTIDNVIDTTATPAPPIILQADAALAYVAGNSFINWDTYAAARPDLASKGWLISVTLTCLGHGRCYDIEPGGGKNQNIGIFMKHADRTHGLPWLYTFASNHEAMVAAAASFGWHRGRDYYTLCAHPGTSAGKHICAPHTCGVPFTADGTQWLFHGDYDASILNDYMLPAPAKPVDPYRLFPTDVGDRRMPNGGNERLTVKQADGALEHPDRYRNYLKGLLYGDLKRFRDRIWRVSHYRPPDFTRPRAKADWSDHRGRRWQAINRRMQAIAKL